MVETDGNHANGTAIALDALVVGGGFGGCYLLHLLRKMGLSVKLVDALDGFGGVWRANHYPGIRVDCEMPYYLLSSPEIMEGWAWTEKFPSGDELRRYFDHVDKVWQLSKDTYFETRVTGARYSDDDKLWHISTNKSLRFTCRWFIPACGSTHTQHIPQWPGMDKYKGQLLHPASWPKEDPWALLKQRRIAVIGAGSTAVQVVQEAAKYCTQLSHFIRTPNLAVPMRQESVPLKRIEAIRPQVHELMQHVRSTRQGLPIQRMGEKTRDATEDEREAVWNTTWEKGGFNFNAGSFGDVGIDKEANKLAYAYWAKQQRARIPDPAKRAILVPETQPYWFATKRPSMEQDYYEMVSLPHVDVTNSPITALDETGIFTKDGKHREFDLIVVATGYDAVTGPLKTMGITGRHGLSVSDKWAEGLRTNLGMCIGGFPNMFFPYGPQAPTSLTAGTPFIEQQVEWICQVIDKARQNGWQTVEATKEAEDEWAKLNNQIANKTLFVETDSWYMGANVPGKRREPLLFLGGMVLYFQKCREALDGMKGFACAS